MRRNTTLQGDFCAEQGKLGGLMIVLGIETSCDETGVAVYDSERGLLADRLYSQVDIHARYGGVVPELASRDHVRKTLPLIHEVLEAEQPAVHDVDGVVYAAGTGLVGAARVGAARGRAAAGRAAARGRRAALASAQQP